MCPWGQHYLHSTMLLLYRRKTLIIPEGIWIYIPLCFYFIQGGSGSAAGWILFTFHYASTLSPDVSRPGDWSPIFTFHYASTLSYWGSMIPVRWSQIYIPLCFYFITAASMMYMTRCTIYIPLCFYFIQICGMRCLCCITIYIPLCFYFII